MTREWRRLILWLVRASWQKGIRVKPSATLAALGLCALIGLGTAPATGHALTFRTDWVVNFLPPNPCNENDQICSFAGYTLGGMLTLYYQRTEAGEPILLGRTTTGDVNWNTSGAGHFTFDNVDVSNGDMLLLTFGGELVVQDTGPPNLPFYAFPELNPGRPN